MVSLWNTRNKSRISFDSRHQLMMAVGFLALMTIVMVPFISLAMFDHRISVTKTNQYGLEVNRLPDKRDLCVDEYKRITSGAVPGLTVEDLERSVAYVGNRHRLAQLVRKLQHQQPVAVAICGGSITMGHGVEHMNARYSDQLEIGLNRAFPIMSNATRKHRVYNRGSHGADICAMAKRINFLNLPSQPDLFVLEFAVNDYQGQDHKVHIDHKTDVFFDGFASLAECAETVVYKLLADYPNTAVIFLEFQTAILNRKTAQLLHMGVAQHYQVPVVSYADTLWPSLYTLFDSLQPNQYSVASNVDIDKIAPYPHGCAPCQAEQISKQFRDMDCKSICVFAARSGLYHPIETCDQGESHRPCFVPFLAHDAVHPSAVGHQIASDLILDLLAQVDLLLCQDPHRVFAPYVLPTHSGWLVGGSNYQQDLRKRSDFVLVQDTMEIFANQNPLTSKVHSSGFNLKTDDLARKGWIAENPAGGETVTFDINLPLGECYVIVISVLRSYERVGAFTVTVDDVTQKRSTKPFVYDCKWKPLISVPADVTLTSDDQSQCTGQCKVTISTNPEISDGRQGNLIKIMSLAVRKCISSAKSH